MFGMKLSWVDPSPEKSLAVRSQYFEPWFCNVVVSRVRCTVQVCWNEVDVKLTAPSGANRSLRSVLPANQHKPAFGPFLSHDLSSITGHRVKSLSIV